MRTVDIGGVAVGEGTAPEWVDWLAERLQEGIGHHHVSLNAAKWVAMQGDPALQKAVQQAHSVAADGMAIVWASRGSIPTRTPGCDLALALLERAAQHGWRVALVGARDSVVEEVAKRLDQQGVTVVLARNGYFAPSETEALVNAVRAARPQLLLLALGTPKAEVFAHAHLEALSVPLVLGVGGTFDVIAGSARRAPAWVGEAGLEWAWRLAGAPRARFGRAVVDPLRFFWGLRRHEQDQG